VSVENEVGAMIKKLESRGEYSISKDRGGRMEGWIWRTQNGV
jgi:hypothetical protein